MSTWKTALNTWNLYVGHIHLPLAFKRDGFICSILLLKLGGHKVGKFPGCVNLPRTISGLRGCPCSPPSHVPSSAFEALDHWLGDRRRCHHTRSNTRGWWSEALGQRPGHLVACEYSEYSCANSWHLPLVKSADQAMSQIQHGRSCSSVRYWDYWGCISSECGNLLGHSSLFWTGLFPCRHCEGQASDLDTEPSDKCRWGGAAIRRCYHVTSAKESWFDTKVVSWRFQAVKVGRKHWDHPKSTNAPTIFSQGKACLRTLRARVLRDLYLWLYSF